MIWSDTMSVHSMVSAGRETTAGWCKAFDVFILGLVSDGAPANLKMARWLRQNLPANALLLHHVCDLCLSPNGHVICQRQRCSDQCEPWVMTYQHWHWQILVQLLVNGSTFKTFCVFLNFRHESNHCVDGVWAGLGLNSMWLDSRWWETWRVVFETHHTHIVANMKDIIVWSGTLMKLTVWCLIRTLYSWYTDTANWVIGLMIQNQITASHHVLIMFHHNNFNS